MTWMEESKRRGKSEQGTRTGVRSKGQGRQTEAGKVNCWQEQTEASLLSPLPFHRLECNPRFLGPAAPLSGNISKSKML